MATIATSKLQIAGRGHIFYNAVDSAPIDLSKFKFSDASTYGTWTWLGDSSYDDLIEFKVDGGDVTQKRTWDRLNVRAVREDTTVSATINSVNVSAETFTLAYGGSVVDTASKSYKVGMSPTSVQKAIMIVIEDGSDISGMYLPKTDIKGDFPKFDGEDFTQFPMQLAVLGSDTLTAGTSGALGWQWFEPRPMAS